MQPATDACLCAYASPGCDVLYRRRCRVVPVRFEDSCPSFSGVPNLKGLKRFPWGWRAEFSAPRTLIDRRILFPLFHLRFCFDSFRSWVGVSQAREYSFASLLGGYDLSYGDNFFLYRLWNILIGNCIPYLFLFWLLRIARESSCLLFVSIDNFPTSEAIQ